MSAFKGTPGPWLLDMNNVHAGSVATVHHCTDGWADIWSDRWCDSGMGPEVMDANASLIAAAPELLEALQDLVDVAQVLRAETLGDENDQESRIATARFVISKALGSRNETPH